MSEVSIPLLSVHKLAKRYTRGIFGREVTFSLEADFALQALRGANLAEQHPLFLR